MSSTFTYTYHTLQNSMLLYDPNPVSIYMYLGYEMHDINFFLCTLYKINKFHILY